MKKLLKIFALIVKNLSKTGVILEKVEFSKFSSAGFSSLMGFFWKVKFLENIIFYIYFVILKESQHKKDFIFELIL